MNISPARITVFEILLRVTTDEGYASNLLSSARYENLSSADHGLAHELTLGVLRWQAYLDFFIEHFTKRKIKKLDAEVVIALRLGLYQLLFLDRVPAHAAINDAVNLVKLHKKKSAAPMVNAVLRSVQRTGKIELEKIAEAVKDPLEKLSITTSHPVWLLQKWAEKFGAEEAKNLAEANNHAPHTAFRFNRKVQEEAKTREWFAANNIQFRASEICPEALVLEVGNISSQSEAIQSHWIYLQDEASQLVAYLAANSPTAHPSFLDLCAAPGSKTSLMASLLPEEAIIVACDLHLHRLQTMRELAARANISNINLLQLDATKSLPFAAEKQFDLVLLDAPCSGLGTLQRHPEIKWRVTQEKIFELAALQKSLLENAGAQVSAGGILAYSVCSTEPEEGEEVIAEFCAGHAEFRDVTRERSTKLGVEASRFLTPSVGARTFTHKHGCESFFVCLLEKSTERQKSE